MPVTLKVSEVWKGYELDLINYQNKCRLIRGWDDLFDKVKEHINSVAAMKLSPYYRVSRRLQFCIANGRKTGYLKVTNVSLFGFIFRKDFW